MRDTALVVGGTRFVGRHTVSELLDAGYRVTLFNRGRHDDPFADHPRVRHVRGDRTERADLERAAGAARRAYDAVVDCVAYRPREVRVATEVFADAGAYVYVSSGDAYGAEEVPKREGETDLEPCTEAQATDEGPATYGPRKAEGDRAVFAAAERGVRAMSVRPTIVYGPHDYTGRFDYWVDRVGNDRVLVPGDGDAIWHLAGVESVARALRTVAEEGTAGRAYNVGDRRLFPLSEFVERVAAAAGEDVEVVTAPPERVERAGVDPDAVPFYRRYPHVLATERLAGLGWEPVDPERALAETVAATLERGPDPDERAPDRATERDALERLGAE